MKKRALIATSFLVFSLIGLTGVVAFPSYMGDFGGTDHAGCHATNPMGTWPTIITTANFTLALSNTSTLETNSYFLLTAYVNNFTEVCNIDYDNETTIGFSFNHTTPNDNSKFLYKPMRFEETTLDANGYSITGVTFKIVTPSSPGTYKLLITAVSGYNHSASGLLRAASLLYVDAELDLLVTPLTYVNLGPGGETSIPGFDLVSIIFALFIAIVPISILIIRKRRKYASIRENSN